MLRENRRIFAFFDNSLFSALPPLTSGARRLLRRTGQPAPAPVRSQTGIVAPSHRADTASGPRSWRAACARTLGSLTLAGLLLAAGSQAAYAQSAGCVAINGGGASASLGSGESGATFSLEAGDVLNFSFGVAVGSVFVSTPDGKLPYDSPGGAYSLIIQTDGTYGFEAGTYSDGQKVTIAASCAGRIDQTITFIKPDDRPYHPTTPFTLSSLATSNQTVTYSSKTPAVCTVDGSSVTTVSAGTCTIAANQAGNATYNPAPEVTRSFEITKASQTITFGAQSGQTFGPGGTFELDPTASASSELTVTYSSQTPAACSISGTTVTMAAAGTCTIAADQAGNDNYDAATPVSQNIAIGKADQSITFGSQGSQTFIDNDTFELDPAASADSELPVSYSSQTPAVCSISGTTVTMTGAGSCIIAVDQAGNDDFNAATQVTQTIAIAKAGQTITFGSQTPQTYGPNGTFELSPAASTDSPLEIRYESGTPAVCTIEGTTVTTLSAGTCIITAIQDGDDNYESAQEQQQITIGKADQTITFDQPSAQPFEPGFQVPLTASASSDLGVAFTSETPAICTVSGSTVTVVTQGTCTIVASQPGNGNYNGAQDVSRSFEISQAATQTTLSLSPTNPLLGQSVTLSVTVTAGTGTPDGTVTIYDGANVVCTVTLVAGSGSCVTSFTTGGAHEMTAAYAGTPSFAPSSAAGVTAMVTDQRERTVGLIGQFLTQRNNQILTNEPGTLRQVDRLQSAARHRDGTQIAFPWPSSLPSGTGAQGAAQGPAQLPVQVNITPAGTVGAASFAASGAALNPEEFKPLDFWIEGKFSALAVNGESDGKFGMLSLGADYVVDPNLLVGVMGQIDAMSLDTDGDDPSSIGGVGYLVGPYATARLTDDVFLQARAAWGRSSNEISPFDTYTDSFESTRWLLSAKLIGSWSTDNWRFSPSVSLAYMQDISASYEDSFGVTIPSVFSELGQMRAGSQVSYVHTTQDGTIIEPFVNAQIIWNFANATATGFTLDGEQVGPSGPRGSVELGIRSRNAAGSTIDVSVGYDGIGASNYRAFTGKLSASFPLN